MVFDICERMGTEPKASYFYRAIRVWLDVGQTPCDLTIINQDYEEKYEKEIK